MGADFAFRAESHKSNWSKPFGRGVFMAQRILHLVNDLNGYGGAEMTLLRYLSERTEARADHHILALRDIGEGPSVGQDLAKLGIPIRSLGVTGAKSALFALPELLREARRARPDMISAWLYYPSLIAVLIRPFLKGSPQIVWHIRSLPYVRFADKPARYVTQRVLALFSHLPRIAIVTNSTAARRAHVDLGFSKRPGKWAVIANAIDPKRYAPNPALRAGLRSEWRVPSHGIVIGAIGRVVPEKAYPDYFLALAAAFAMLPAEMKSRIHIVIAGRGASRDDEAFVALAAATGLSHENIHLLGQRQDVPNILAGLDMFVLPSKSESFPNVLAEAMATGLPAISTDVGDCALVLGDRRFIAYPIKGETLADRIATMIKMSLDEREAIGRKNRERAMSVYTLARMVAGFDAVFARDKRIFQPAASPNRK